MIGATLFGALAVWVHAEGSFDDLDAVGTDKSFHQNVDAQRLKKDVQIGSDEAPALPSSMAGTSQQQAVQRIEQMKFNLEKALPTLSDARLSAARGALNSAEGVLSQLKGSSKVDPETLAKIEYASKRPSGSSGHITQDSSGEKFLDFGQVTTVTNTSGIPLSNSAVNLLSPFTQGTKVDARGDATNSLIISLAVASDRTVQTPLAGDEASAARPPEGYQKVKSLLDQNTVNARKELSLQGAVASLDPQSLEQNYPVSDRERATEVNAYMKQALTGAKMFAERNPKNNQLLKNTPEEIRGLVKDNLRDIQRAHAGTQGDVQALPYFDALLNNGKFQDFAEKSLGSEALNKINTATAAAISAQDKRLDALDLALLRVAANKQGKFALSGAAPVAIIEKQMRQKPTRTPATAQSAAAASENTPLSTELAALLGQPNETSGLNVSLESSTWIDMARYLGKAPSELKWVNPAIRPDPAAFIKGLGQLEVLIRELRALKALDLLGLIQMPSDERLVSINSAASAAKPVEAKKNAANFLFNPMRDLAETRAHIRRILNSASRWPADLASPEKDQQALLALRNHATLALIAFDKYQKTEEKIEVCKVVMRDQAMRKIWQRLAPKNYVNLRRATAVLVMASVSAATLDEKSNFLVMLNSTAGYLQHRFELAASRIKREKDEATLDTGSRSTKANFKIQDTSPNPDDDF